MKRLLSVFLLLVFVLSGCGAGDSPTVSTEGSGGSTTISGGPEGRFATISLESWRAEPRIDPPDLPPPKKTLVRDLRVGRGPVARKGDWMTVYYFGVSYRTGLRVYSTWPPNDPYERTLYAADAWEKGIVGMRVGGRRELVIPSRLAFNDGAMIYIVDLLDVEPTPKRGRGTAGS